MQQIIDLFNMHQYSVYVYSAYAVVGVSFIGLAIKSVRQSKSIIKTVQEHMERS